MNTLNILIVEDNDSTCELLKLLLTGEGHTVRTVPCVAAAAEELLGKLPDVVILDFCLPGHDGLHFLHWLRERFPDAVLPVILSTALSEQDCQALEEAVRTLPDVSLLRKPYPPVDLLALLEQIRTKK